MTKYDVIFVMTCFRICISFGFYSIQHKQMKKRQAPIHACILAHVNVHMHSIRHE